VSMTAEERAARRLLAGMLIGLLCGIALAATGSPTVGGLIATAGLGGTAWGLHRLGRAGSNALSPKPSAR